MDKVDFIVGIPSYNEADSISFVTKQADIGLQKYFGSFNTVIVNVDNNSPDNTKDVFLQTPTKTPKNYITTPKGVKGKGNNFFNLFMYASNVGAKGVVVVDADLTSITPEWMLKLGEPILNKNDFVSPLYIRHKYDGTITNNIVFPLVYSLFNKNIRQPIGGDFAVSGRLIDTYLRKQWTETTRQYGIDIFMTMNALLGDFKTAQVMLDAKLHKPSAPKLGPMFIQVVNTLFSLIASNRENLANNNNGCKMPEIDYVLPNIEPPEIEINPDTMKQSSINGYNETKHILDSVLRPDVNKRVSDAIMNDINIDSHLWADIVFDFLKAYPFAKDKLALIDAFKHLYFARSYSFVKNTLNMTSIEAEYLILEQAKVFWEKKGCFLSPKELKSSIILN